MICRVIGSCVYWFLGSVEGCDICFVGVDRCGCLFFL